MNERERWLVGAICFLFLFGSAADWYKKRCPVGELQKSVVSARFVAQEAKGAGAPAGPVDLNRCEAEDLERLPGIGPVRARSIMRWREEKGPFETVEDLKRVPGIGPATLKRLRSDIVVRPPGVGEERGGEDAE